MPQSQDVNPNVVFRQPEVEFILKKKRSKMSKHDTRKVQGNKV